MNSKRIEYIDISKGFAMLAVIFGHIMLTGAGFVIAYGFDIPLFLFISGMMFNKSKYPKLNDFAKSRAKSLLLPYFVFSVVTWALWALLNLLLNREVESCFSPLLQTVLAQGSGQFFVHNYPLWFPTFLFLLEIIYFFICRTPKAVNIIICFIMAFIGYFMIQPNEVFDFTLLPWSIEAVFRGIIFYALGNLFVSEFGVKSISDFTENKKAVSILLWAGCTVLFIAGALYNGLVSLGSNVYGKSNVLYYSVGVFGTASALLMSGMLEALNKNRKIKLITFIKWIGANSFYFMALHKPVNGVINLVLVFMESHFNMSFLYGISEKYIPCIISWLITVPATAAAVYIINSIKKKIKEKSA